jgi:PIN domain nuclease of toxin-antitoxin system
VKYLIDTHTLLGIVTNDPKLSAKAKDLYLDSENEIFISMASIWELSIKSSLGKISLEQPLDEFVDEHVKGNDIRILKIELPHVLRIENLPFYHRDPFDRLIISQSIEDNIPIIGSDKTFDSYPIKRIW